MEMRIVVPDAANASPLAERLTVVLRTERISLLGDRPEVDVRVRAWIRSIALDVVDAFERWLEHTLGRISRDVARGPLLPARPMGSGHEAPAVKVGSRSRH
jgi:hypothetical protein